MPVGGNHGPFAERLQRHDRSKVASYSTPGGKIAVCSGDVATILTYIANRPHREVEPLKWPGNWVYAERKIRGCSAPLSNHASETAIDLNPPKNPLVRRGTFSSKQVAAIRRNLKDCSEVVRWGGDYRSRKDEVHFEINAGSAAVAKAVAHNKGKKPPSTSKVPAR